eukprot:TRINITY_DN55546_c0_g1_i2.p1 TRINITY_DN55546_c0_g1~~TRINITY_DN55546_c0_g1_i2.p1  ORF type:complete len:101 (+),score=15.95 TRINITY_DN55546_c0_g1_i2:109-411(+)
MQCQQICQRASTSTIVKANRNVTVCATKKWQKTAAATAFTAAFALSTALPAFAEFSEEELLARVKVRTCNENPTAQICIPKRTQVFEYLDKEVDKKLRSE